MKLYRKTFANEQSKAEWQTINNRQCRRILCICFLSLSLPYTHSILLLFLLLLLWMIHIPSHTTTTHGEFTVGDSRATHEEVPSNISQKKKWILFIFIYFLCKCYKINKLLEFLLLLLFYFNCFKALHTLKILVRTVKHASRQTNEAKRRQHQQMKCRNEAHTHERTHRHTRERTAHTLSGLTKRHVSERAGKGKAKATRVNNNTYESFTERATPQRVCVCWESTRRRRCRCAAWESARVSAWHCHLLKAATASAATSASTLFVCAALKRIATTTTTTATGIETNVSGSATNSCLG